MVTKSLYDAYFEFNWDVANAPEGFGVLTPQMHAQDWHIEGIGFGLPERAPYYMAVDGNYEKRVKLLAARYIQPMFWDIGMDQIRSTPKLKGPANKQSQLVSQTVLFYREGSHKLGTGPDGGGCLISLVFTRFGKRNGVHVFARASETIKALIGDLYFFRYLVRRAIIEAELTDWNEEELHLRWTSTYGAQKSYFFPVLLQDYGGDELVKQFYVRPFETKWQRFLHRYFWRFTLFPDRVKWPVRRRPGEQFLANTSTDWWAIGKEMGYFEMWPDSGRSG